MLNALPVNLSPIVISAGRDKVLLNSQVHYGVRPDFSIGQNPQYDPQAEEDNIYGFRSRGVGRH